MILILQHTPPAYTIQKQTHNLATSFGTDSGQSGDFLGGGLHGDRLLGGGGIVLERASATKGKKGNKGGSLHGEQVQLLIGFC